VVRYKIINILSLLRVLCASVVLYKDVLISLMQEHIKREYVFSFFIK